MKTGVYKTEQIVRYFIEKGYADARPLTNLGLQKLLYYGQGLYQAAHHRPLFREPLFACETGARVRSVNDRYSRYQMQAIPASEVPAVAHLLQEDSDFLDEVWDVFSGYTPRDLELNIRNETPWKTVNRKSIESGTSIRQYELNLSEVETYFTEHYINFDKIKKNHR